MIYASKDMPSNVTTETMQISREDPESGSLLEMPTMDLMKELYSLGEESQDLRDEVYEGLKNKRLNQIDGAVVR
jgi:hypothetical protein